MYIYRVGVVGAGTMGAQIAQVVSYAGLPVVLTDVTMDRAQRGMEIVRRIYHARVERGKMTPEQAEEKMLLVSTGSDFTALQDVDLVIEAVSENLALKRQVLHDLDAGCAPGAILASNTSALSISALSAGTRRPGKVLGLHFFNPAYAMPLVEIIPGLATDPETVNDVVSFAESIRKLPIVVRECAGFLVNRLLMASRVLALEALVKISGLWADAQEDVRLESAAIKILSTEWLLESLLDLFRLYGGRAFETPDSLRLRGEIPVPIERMIRDSLINVIWEGTNGILGLWIGREGLEEYFKQGQGFLNFQLTEMLRATPFFITVASRSVNALGYEKNGTAAPYEAWERFVAEKSRELARKTLLITARHRQRLVPKQMLMKRFVKASMNLLAIEAAVWYASQPAIQANPLSQCLLEHFCSQLKEEFDPTPLLTMMVFHAICRS